MAKDESGPITTEQLLEVVRSLAAAQSLTVEKIAEISAAAAAAAHQKVSAAYDERSFENKSFLNPLGERNFPRPKLAREILWVGYRLQEEDLSKDEIDLLNQVVPGIYREGLFRVTELDPGLPNGRLLVMFPCQTPDQRSNLMRYDRGNGMVDILRELIPVAASV